MTNKEKFEAFLFFKNLTLELGYTFESHSFEEDINFSEGYDLDDLTTMDELSFYLYGEGTSVGVVINFDKKHWFPAYDAYYIIGNVKKLSLSNETKEKFKNLIALLLSK